MKDKKLFLLLILAAFLLTRCANVVAPTGGAKDITPPKVAEANPVNKGKAFNGRKIELTFDEYVTLNNASQQVLFSPPLANKPDIKLSNKTVVIKLKEDLRPNTTYTIDLGDAVKDLHEGNVFKDYTYTFSTGDVLDTLNLHGTVLDAESQKPVEKLYVGLYDASSVTEDSLFLLPCQQAPDYLARTDKEGHFHLHGLPDVPFLVFALEDMNANLYYDLPNERVAFLDTLVCPSDSVSLTLAVFTEVDTNQMLLESKLVEEGLLRFVFRRPADNVAIDMEHPAIDSFQMVKVWSALHDTLNCWFTPNVLDSLRVNIQYDTLININNNFNLRFRETRTNRRPDSKTLKVGNNLKNKMLMQGDDFLLRFPEPITINKDTCFEQADGDGMVFRLTETASRQIDSVNAIHLSDSTFFSVRGRTNDSIDFKFRRAQESDLGNIYIKVCPPEGKQVVVQLTDNKGKVLDQRVIDSVAKVGFTQLIPDKYKLQAIIDSDRDGKWSPGNFHKRFLPETVILYKDALDVKAGWDIDLDEIWKL